MSLILALGLLVLNAEAQPQKLILPEAIASQVESFEPSGALYLKDLNEYLVVSDDTNKKDAALLFFVKADGKVQSTLNEIEGLKKMTDMESVFEDPQGRIYVMSSQGLNKKGKDSKKRNLFVQIKRAGKKLTLTNEVELRPLLLEALSTSKDATIKSLAKNSKQELDIESSYIKGGIIYVGLKGPQAKAGTALILKLGSVDQVFNKTKPSLALSVEKNLDFKAISKEEDLLSDALQDGSDLWLSTTTESGKDSRLWFFNSKTQKLSLKKTFTNARLEAISASAQKSQIMLFFDQGSEGGLFTLHSK